MYEAPWIITNMILWKQTQVIYSSTKRSEQHVTEDKISNKDTINCQSKAADKALLCYSLSAKSCLIHQQWINIDMSCFPTDTHEKIADEVQEIPETADVERKNKVLMSSQEI